MSEAMDARKSFTHLTDNIPEWLKRLDELAVQVADQHTRFARISQSHFTGLRLAKKHDSTESLRPPNDHLDPPSPTLLPQHSVPPIHLPPTSQPTLTKTPLTKEIRRKRKPASNLSGASGAQKYRTRTLIIVYYDSAIQEAFESLVRCIAGARNNLRKGKSAASFKARMISMGIGDDDDDDDAYPVLNPKMMIRRIPRAASPSTSPSFDQADGHLEAAQNLCEVAAHQFLRDGDCEEELEGTRKRFEGCLRVAKEEVDKLRMEEGKESSTKSKVEASTEKKVESRPGPISLAGEKTGMPRIPTVPMLTSNGTIEVDDDSDAGSLHIDMTAVRRTRRV
ncbi:MAG: hypothetical protein L6R40_003964 [Gallowayella cf. fulva]|nr:MAG: hypothetical protein L6R40_003964 [Xanthomendoza cf. fulva]